MNAETPSTLDIASSDIKRGEDIFVALARTYDMNFYLGRLANATEDELRSMYGLTVAALRQAARDILNNPKYLPPSQDVLAAKVEKDVLANRIEQMSAELAQRDEYIRRLTSELEKGSNRG